MPLAVWREKLGSVSRAPLRAAAAHAVPIVVTIHDCIHLRVSPVSAPSARLRVRAQLAVVRDPSPAASSRCRKPRSATSCTTSMCRRRRSRSSTTPIDERFNEVPAEDEVVARARTVSAERSVRALCREHQAAQESRAADRGLPPSPPARIRSAARCSSSATRSPSTPRCGARSIATSCTITCAFSASFPTDARDPLPSGVGVCLSVALRRIRPSAARSHGQRHSRRHVERFLVARGRRRCRSARRSVRARCHRRRDPAGPDRRRPAREPRRARLRAREALLVGTLGARVREIYGEVLAIDGPSRRSAIASRPRRVASSTTG